MQKHPDITRTRIDQFFERELKGAAIVDRAPLKIEKSTGSPTDEKSARSGEWAPVEKGFAYGPAYTSHWFKVAGDIPARMHGKTLAIRAEIGGERTVWDKNSPILGLDWMHEYQRLPGGITKIDYVIESTCRNPQHRIQGKELPREELVETVDTAEVLVLDDDLLGFEYTYDFARNLMKSLGDDSPSAALLMRALNSAINLYGSAEWTGEPVVERCRKTLRDALDSLPGELRHTITPVGHAHLDTAWLWPIEVTKRKMAHTTANQLALMERYPEYVFAHSQASQYEWLEKEYPTLFARVKDAVGRKQWEPVGSMWVEADCNLTGGESLVRQFLYGRRYFREKLGVETHDMWLPDVFGYSAAIPQILDGFGIRYFMTQKMSWNQFNRFPHNTFWWQGIDGSKVWTHFPPADTYNGSCEPIEINRSAKAHRDQARSDQSLYLFGWGDGGGGPTERHLELLRRAKRTAELPVLQLGRTAVDFFRDARAKSRDLATWVGELYFEYHRGTYTSQAANKKGNRISEFLLRDAEWLSCFRDGLAGYPAEELEKAWKLVLLNQFHDIIPGSSVHEVYDDSKRDYEEIRAIGEKIVAESLRTIGGKLATEGLNRPYALFQNAKVPGQAELAWDEPWVPASATCGDESTPVQLIEAFGERKLIFQTPMAALGAVAIVDLSEAPAAVRPRLKASSRRLENSEFAVRFDAQGHITSIQSLEDGTEFIEQGKLGNLFQLFDDKPMNWSAWDVDIYALETGRDLLKSESFELVERGPARVAFELVKRFGKSTIRQRISLGPTPGIRFDTEVDWQETDKLLKVAFPIQANATRATYEIQFGNVERPTHSNTSWDLAKFEMCAQKWIDLSEGEQGVALLNDCKYGHDVKGSLMRLSLLRAPKAPDPTADMGLQRFTYTLLPHFGDYRFGNVVTSAYSLNSPTRIVPVDRSPGVEGQLPPFVSCDDRNLVIESVKRAEDGDGIVVRLYECHNSRGEADLYCVRPIASATRCNLEERAESEVEFSEGTVRIEYRPFEIVTIRLRF